MASANTVKVKALKYFRGEPGEGKKEDGNVAPGDEISVSRQRAAELSANSLIEGFEPAEGEEVAAHSGSSIAIDPDMAKHAEEENQRIANQAAKSGQSQSQAGMVNVTRSQPDVSSKVGSITMNDKRKPSR